jgi:hypothetical protein
MGTTTSTIIGFEVNCSALRTRLLGLLSMSEQKLSQAQLLRFAPAILVANGCRNFAGGKAPVRRKLARLARPLAVRGMRIAFATSNMLPPNCCDTESIPP